MSYQEFLNQKSHLSGDFGFSPLWMPDKLFDFQKFLVEWACQKGRSAIFADCGLGKTFMQLAWAENVVKKTNKRVLILTPLAVAKQTCGEAEKLGVEVTRSRDGKFSSSQKIIITNYERLHYFNPHDFDGACCDESSIIKHWSGATQKKVTRFMAKKPYRLLCTATAAPNDWPELGTSSEALGELSFSDMRKRFFRQLDDKGQKKAFREQKDAEKKVSYYGKLSFRVSQSIGQWRLKNHAVNDFWKWVSSWARACQMPSDLGFSDEGFQLPPLIENDHIIHPDSPPDGFLFTLPAVGLQEEREERKRTLKQRVEFAASLVDHRDQAVVWCHYNAEGDALERAIPDAVQVAGKTPDEEKEEIYDAFLSGEQRVLITKPKIGAWGLNWQHCAHTVTFATHSYEQYYQSLRRFWRFGQKNPVRLDVIASEGEQRVLENMRRKSAQAQVMFAKMLKFMNQSQKITQKSKHQEEIEVPAWIQ